MIASSVLWLVWLVIAAIDFFALARVYNGGLRALWTVAAVFANLASLGHALSWNFQERAVESDNLWLSALAAIANLIFYVVMLFCGLWVFLEWRSKKQTQKLSEELTTAVMPIVEKAMVDAVIADRAKRAKDGTTQNAEGD